MMKTQRKGRADGGDGDERPPRTVKLGGFSLLNKGWTWMLNVKIPGKLYKMQYCMYGYV